MKKGANATIRDVARAAEVSVATVSKYVNGTKRFSPEVEFRLKETIEKLGYQTSPLARSMITGRTRTIGLVILDISNPHFASVVKGANRTALAHDYTLLLVDTEEDAARELQTVFLNPGASQTVTVNIDPKATNHPLSTWDKDAQQWSPASGATTVYVGNSSRNVVSAGTITQ
ncbi:LacI family DNA-binding transcriptional regulator [Burkholderia cenocepacia]|nr:LacI family DNA-binding transcriptional regulator [Burkholderia cenocepacia]RQU74038.1 LacI family DNA-binding transcriptional regulator [Burkholderia cenocepacia]RQU94732.1 LacI family DNA-binding transcriptional regulator [Burkholderia cenocepacia]